MKARAIRVSSFRFGLLALVLAPLGACSDEKEPAAPMTTDPSAETSAVLAMITDYTGWSKFPESSTPTRSATHENMFVVTYQNPVVAQATATPLPDGSLIVKANYAAENDTQPMALTIRHKQGADWYWIKASADGKVFLDDQRRPLEGKGLGMCLMCHDLAVNDGVRGHDF